MNDLSKEEEKKNKLEMIWSSILIVNGHEKVSDEACDDEDFKEALSSIFKEEEINSLLKKQLDESSTPPLQHIRWKRKNFFISNEM